MVSFTRTYEQATNTIKFYQDTTLLGTQPVTTTGLSTSESLRLGYYRGIPGGSSSGADYFHGRMGEVRIYDRALTINEVYHNFNLAEVDMSIRYGCKRRSNRRRFGTFYGGSHIWNNIGGDGTRLHLDP